MRQSECLNYKVFQKYLKQVTHLVACKQFFKAWIQFQLTTDITNENSGSICFFDHTFPCLFCILLDEKRTRKCFIWTNTRPRLAKNIIKKQNKVEFRLYLSKQVYFHAFIVLEKMKSKL